MKTNLDSLLQLAKKAFVLQFKLNGSIAHNIRTVSFSLEISKHFICRIAMLLRVTYNWNSIPTFSNAQSDYINYHPNFCPSILRQTDTNLILIQEISINIPTKKLKFVSCHKEQASWISAILELVTVFDLYTWLTLVGFYCGFAYNEGHQP